MQNDIDKLILEPFGQKLLDARNHKGYSQRALAEKTGVPQAHISKIEQGRVDIRLSSLVELARALDLEVQLLPRHAVSAVEGAVRAVKSETANAVESRVLATLVQYERTLEQLHMAFPETKVVEKLVSTIEDLKRMSHDRDTLKALQNAFVSIEQVRLQHASTGLDEVSLAKLLAPLNRRLRTVRNARAHGLSPSARPSAIPAYRLDDEDDDD